MICEFGGVIPCQNCPVLHSVWQLWWSGMCKLMEQYDIDFFIAALQIFHRIWIVLKKIVEWAPELHEQRLGWLPFSNI